MAALAIAALAVGEGLNAWRGESCCVPTDTGPDTETAGHNDECCVVDSSKATGR